MNTINYSKTDSDTNNVVNPAQHVSQFLLGAASTPCPDGWTKTAITGELQLSTHPELSITHSASNDRSLTLIGFMLDPDLPDATDTDIVSRLLEGHTELDSLITATERLGGRWVLIATYGKNKYLFHDPFGLRQAFYTDPELSDTLLVMSQPRLGADQLNLTIDDAAQRFIDSYEFRSEPEYRWPGTNTPYKEIQHLFPNHYLDLNTRLPHRFWPNRRLNKIELNDAVIQLSELFSGLMKSATARFDLALGVTAGIDSRLVLAASKDVKDKITYITVRQWMAPDDHADIVVTGKLLDRLGLTHTVIKAPVTTSPEFSKVFKNNVFLAHDHYGPDAEAILKYFDRKKVVVTGGGAEVGRCYHDLTRENDGVPSAEYLSRVEEMGSNKYAIQHFQQWIDNLGGLYNVDLLDLFEWENGHGNWLAMTQLEFDIAWKDILTPYNCRASMNLMLSVEEQYRKGPENTLFLEIIRNMWPEVLCEPINPHKKPERKSLRRRIKNRIKKLIGFSD